MKVPTFQHNGFIRLKKPFKIKNILVEYVKIIGDAHFFYDYEYVFLVTFPGIDSIWEHISWPKDDLLDLHLFNDASDAFILLTVNMEGFLDYNED